MSRLFLHGLLRLYAYLVSSIGLPTVQLSFVFLRIPPMVRRAFPLILFPEATLGHTYFMTRRIRYPLYFYIEARAFLYSPHSPGSSAAGSLSFCTCPWSSCNLLKPIIEDALTRRPPHV